MPIEIAEETVETETPAVIDDSGSDAQIPMSLLAGKDVNPGDVIRLEVVSKDEESQMVTVKYAAPDQPLKGDDTIGRMAKMAGGKQSTMEMS